MSWYKTGDEGAKKAKEEDERRQELNDQPWRFWLAPDKSARIMFLDNEGLR